MGVSVLALVEEVEVAVVQEAAVMEVLVMVLVEAVEVAVVQGTLVMEVVEVVNMLVAWVKEASLVEMGVVVVVVSVLDQGVWERGQEVVGTAEDVVELEVHMLVVWV